MARVEPSSRNALAQPQAMECSLAIPQTSTLAFFRIGPGLSMVMSMLPRCAREEERLLRAVRAAYWTLVKVTVCNVTVDALRDRTSSTDGLRPRESPPAQTRAWAPSDPVCRWDLRQGEC